MSNNEKNYAINYELGVKYIDIGGMLGERGDIYKCIRLIKCTSCDGNLTPGLRCAGKPEWEGRGEWIECDHWVNYEFKKIAPTSLQDRVTKFRDKIRKEVENNGN